MSLVGNDGVAALLQAHAVLDSAQHEGEGLDGDDDDGLRVLQRLRELLGFGAIAFLIIDAAHGAIDMLELIDGVLQLRIEHRAIRHHDHGIETLVAVRVIERGKLMRHPRDGI